MSYDKKLIASKLRRWESYLDSYQLPKWEEIPDFGLYMEQVLILLTEYLDYMPPELKEEQFITAAAINNYVRKKIMPEPVRKKYYRVHIACLVLICSLKQTLSMTTLKTLLPNDVPEEEFREFYDRYVERHRMTAGIFIDLTKKMAAGILDHEDPEGVASEDPMDLILSATEIAGFSRLLAEKLILLNDLTLEEGEEMGELPKL